MTWRVGWGEDPEDSQEISMRVDLPSLLALRAALANRRGNPQEAHRRLREANRLYVDMSARGHAKRLARELGL